MAKERLSKLQKEILSFLADPKNLDAQQKFHWRSKKMDCVKYETLMFGSARAMGMKIETGWVGNEYIANYSFEPSFSRSLKNLYLKGLIAKEGKRIMYGKYGTSKIWLTKEGRAKVKKIS